MVLALACGVVLAAAPPRFAAPGLSGVGISPDKVSALNEHLAAHFSVAQIVTQKDVATLLGFERQKQLLGCAEDGTSCLAELAGALGVDGLVLGDVTTLGAVTQLNIKVITARDGKRIANFSERVSQEEDLFPAIERAARVLERDALAALGFSAPRFSGAWALLPGAIALGAAGAGTALHLMARSDYDALRAPTPPQGGLTGLQLKQQGESRQLAANVLLGVGAAAAAGAIVLAFLGGSSDAGPPVAIAPGPDGSIVVRGVFP